MRRTFACLVGTIALAMVLAAAASGSGRHMAALNFSLGSTCAGGGSVTYTWSGFHHVSDVRVIAFDQTAMSHSVNVDQSAGSSGTLTFTFDETNGDIYNFEGFLQNDKGQTEKGSDQLGLGQLASCS